MPISIEMSCGNSPLEKTGNGSHPDLEKINITLQSLIGESQATQQVKSDAFKSIILILFRSSGEGVVIQHLKEKILPVALNYISSCLIDEEIDPPLEFLGNFLQAYKLKTGEADNIIEILTERITRTTSKLESRKSMWCLENIQFPEDITEEKLERVLEASFLYLDEYPPIDSVSTTCEAINVLKNLHKKKPEFIQSRLPEVLEVVFPLLFHRETVRIRELTYNFLHPLAPIISERKLFTDVYQENYRVKYNSLMIEWITSESIEAVKLWRFLIASFGPVLHSNHMLLNDLLKAEEIGLKSKNPRYRLFSLESWRWLINCFALNHSMLFNPKRLKLIMTPFTAAESKSQEIAETKIKLWWHLLHRLGNKALDSFQEVTMVLLKFCFGSPKKPGGAIDAYPNIIPLALSSLIGILSPSSTYKVGRLERSSPFMDLILFIKNCGEFLFIFDRVFSTMTPDNVTVYGILFETFVDRCSEADPLSDWGSIVIEQLSQLIAYFMEMPSHKPSSSAFILSSFTRLMNKKIFFEAFQMNFKTFLKWPVIHELKFKMESYNSVIDKCFEVGTKDTNAVLLFVKQIAYSFEEVKNNGRAITFKIHIAHLWSKFVMLLLKKLDSFKLMKLDKTLFYFPLTIVLEMRTRCDLVWVAWMKFFNMLLVNDSTFFDKFRSKSVDTLSHRSNETVLGVHLLKFVIRTIFLHGLDSYKEKILYWVKEWTKSWTQLHDHGKGDVQKSCKVLATLFTSFIKDAPAEVQMSLAETVVKQLRTTYPRKTINNIRVEVQVHVLQDTGVNCAHLFPSLKKPMDAVELEEIVHLEELPIDSADPAEIPTAVELEKMIQRAPSVNDVLKKGPSILKEGRIVSKGDLTKLKKKLPNAKECGTKKSVNVSKESSRPVVFETDMAEDECAVEMELIEAEEPTLESTFGSSDGSELMIDDSKSSGNVSGVELEEIQDPDDLMAAGIERPADTQMEEETLEMEPVEQLYEAEDPVQSETAQQPELSQPPADEETVPNDECAVEFEEIVAQNGSLQHSSSMQEEAVEMEDSRQPLMLEETEKNEGTQQTPVPSPIQKMKERQKVPLMMMKEMEMEEVDELKKLIPGSVEAQPISKEVPMEELDKMEEIVHLDDIIYLEEIVASEEVVRTMVRIKEEVVEPKVPVKEAEVAGSVLEEEEVNIQQPVVNLDDIIHFDEVLGCEEVICTTVHVPLPIPISANVKKELKSGPSLKGKAWKLPNSASSTSTEVKPHLKTYARVRKLSQISPNKDDEPLRKMECLENVRRSSRPPKLAPWLKELSKNRRHSASDEDSDSWSSNSEPVQFEASSSFSQYCASTQKLIASDIKLQSRTFVLIERLPKL